MKKSNSKKGRAQRPALSKKQAEFLSEFEKAFRSRPRKKKASARRTSARTVRKKVSKSGLRRVASSEVRDWEKLFRKVARLKEVEPEPERRLSPSERQPEESRDQDIIANTGRLISFEGITVQLNAGDDSVFLNNDESFLSFTKMAGEIIYDYHRLIDRKKKKGDADLSPFTIWTTNFITNTDGTTLTAFINVPDVILIGLTPEEVKKFDLSFYFFKYF
jgi:hypothetical protein